jgi:hypothetical protein
MESGMAFLCRCVVVPTIHPEFSMVFLASVLIVTHSSLSRLRLIVNPPSLLDGTLACRNTKLPCLYFRTHYLPPSISESFARNSLTCY